MPLDEANAPRSRPKILVMDDDHVMRELLKLHLCNNGYQVLVAEDAVVAGHLVVEKRPDLIIADVEMPYMNGYEFVAALKNDPTTKDIPVIFLTTEEHVADRAKKLGAVAYFNKPVVADRLIELVALFAAR